MDLASQRPASGRGSTLRVVLVAFAFVALLAVAPRAEAAELLYWNNHRPADQTIAFANGDGTGGGLLNLTGAQLEGPEGMAIDTVTGRLFVASSGGGPGKTGEILFANLDGSGAGVFTAPGAPVDVPYGVVIDPATRLIYWANEGIGLGNAGSIAWAKLDGSAGGVLNTTGAMLANPYKIALDPVNGRVYWGNYPGPGEIFISYANVDNTGGGNLALSKAPESAYGFAVDPAAGRLYWSEGGQNRFAYTGLLGGVVTTLDTTGAILNKSYGFAVDPTAGRIYWPNYDNDANRVNGFGFASTSGGGGGNITPATAPFDGPQDLLLLKSPTGAGAPTVTRSRTARSSLTCPTGSWAADFPGSFVYQAPQSYAYQWTRDGKPVSAATATTLTAKSAGSYACTVTATNQAGSGSQISAPVRVTAAKLKLAVKTKKVSAKAGSVATFKVQALNQGDLQAKKPKLCVKVPKKARKALKAAKCASLGKVDSRARKVRKLKVEVGPAATGTYKLKIVVKGSAGKAAKATLRVIG